MKFDLDGKTYTFNPIFDGWKLATCASLTILTGGAAELRLESGESLQVRHGDIQRIYDLLTRRGTSVSADVG